MTTDEKTVENEVTQTESKAKTVDKSYLRPVTDVYKDDDAVRILMDVPGANDEDIEVSVHDGQLSILAEVNRSEEDVRVYERSFRMDRRMDTAKIEALLQRGVLQLRIPFHEEARPKRIQVRTAS
ncbi:Hsp20/alpha crystallin family protein [Kiritimatiellaeota bacterium B1221]|nr:Hsp20/alpha crystallin family protein [Kiritimatiellaeota bacterium B1221]